MCCRTLILALLGTAVFDCAAVWAQPYMSIADRFCSDSLYGHVHNLSLNIHWSESGNELWYRADGDDGKSWYLANVKTGKRTRIGSTDGLMEAKSNHAERSGDWRCRYTSDSLFHMTADGDNLLLFRHVSGITDSVYLSFDGEHFHSFASGGNSNRYAAGPKIRTCPNGEWIGDSHAYLVVREDRRKVRTFSLLNSLAEPVPEVETYKFPVPGDENVTEFEVWLADADSMKLYRIPVEKYKNQILVLPRFRNFQTGGGAAYILRLARTRDTLDLVRIDAVTHEARTVISETCRPHLNEQLFSWHLINDGKEILWWSERTGKGQWYLYDSDGNMKSSVRGDGCVCGDIERIDTAGRSVIMEVYGAGRNPHYRHYAKASLDGRKFVLLTPEEGEHNIEISPDGKTLFDSWSRMDLPPRYEIRDLKGRKVMTLDTADISELYAAGWKAPEVLELMAADSVTKLYGVVYLPFNIEPGRKYPIISNVYPGPHTDLVPQAFTIDDNGNQSLAQLGFIVINFSYRGACPLRGRDFYGFGYGNLRDYALDDDYAVIRQVAERYPFADIGRVGIYGHSGGGFMAVAAMLERPDFYKVCVSASGNHDNNIYTQWWGETFHGGHWVQGKDGEAEFECRIPTNMELAGNLRGRLLLITGDMDNNVHPANTFRLADALIKNNKRFDMLVIPGADHGLGDRYYMNVIRYYFVENLLGLPQDDIDIVNHR